MTESIVTVVLFFSIIDNVRHRTVQYGIYVGPFFYSLDVIYAIEYGYSETSESSVDLRRC